MTLHFVTRIIRQPASILRRMKFWGADVGMVADGYTEGGIDQFAFIKVFQIDTDGTYIGDMSANNVGPTLSHFDMLHIAELQTADEYSVDQKMEWCTCGGASAGSGSVTNGCVMEIPGGGNWSTAASIRMIGAVYAGNLVEVLETNTFSVRYNGIVANVPMSRIRTFDKSQDWGKTYFTHPYLVHRVMAVGRDDIPHKPRGNVYLPLIFKYPSVWIFDRWLE